MKKTYCIKCYSYTKFENPKMLHIFKKAWLLSIIWDEGSSNNNTIFKKEQSIKKPKIFSLIDNINK